MSPRLQQVLTEIAQLTPEERSQLIEQIQQMQSFETPPKKSWQDLEGIASNLLNGEDAQVWVNQLRDEWDERDRQIRGQ
jgi:chromosome segregation ATPase